MDTVFAALLPIARSEAVLSHHREALHKLRRQVDRLQRNVDKCAQAISDNGAAQREAARREAELSDKADTLQRRIASTEHALNQGLTDAAAGEHQLASYAEQLEEVESAQLEAMEHQEALSEALPALQEALDEARKAQAIEGAPLGPRVQREQQAIRELTDEQPTLVEGLPRDIRARYDRLKDKLGTTTALVQERACSACTGTVPMATKGSLQSGHVESCPHCGRWLFLPTQLQAPA